MQSIEYISHWELVWEEAKPFNYSLPEVDFKEGITCHIPSEKATYCLNPTGGCWRFTQDPAGGLTYEKIAPFSGRTGPQTFFAFPAGSIQEQALHVGTLDQQQITLVRYKNRAWKPVGSYKLDVEALRTHARGAACSIHKRGKLHGLIVLSSQASWRPSVMLIYDDSTKTFTRTDAWNCQATVRPDTAIEIAPAIVLLGSSDSTYPKWRACVAKVDNNKSVVLPLKDEAERLDLFVLQAKGGMKKSIIVLNTKKDKKTNLEFYTLEVDSKGNRIQPSAHLSEKLEKTDKGKAGKKTVDKRIDHSKSLVIPFSDVMYVVTKDKDGGLVYYKGSIQDPSKRIEVKAQDNDLNTKKTSN